MTFSGKAMTDQESTRRFYKYVWPERTMVLRSARFLLRDAALAEDLAQEVMLKAFRSMASFDVSTNVRAWLSTILRNTRIDQVRVTSNRPDQISLEQSFYDVQDRGEPASDGSLDPVVIIEQLSDQVLIDGLNSLPEEIRWTLLLVDVEQLDQQDAANVLQVPVGTVKSRLFRGRRMLRDLLMKSHGTREQTTG